MGCQILHSLLGKMEGQMFGFNDKTFDISQKPGNFRNRRKKIANENYVQLHAIWVKYCGQVIYKKKILTPHT